MGRALTTVGPSHHCRLASQLCGAVPEVPKMRLIQKLHIQSKQEDQEEDKATAPDQGAE